jgi:glutathione S-transferase
MTATPILHEDARSGNCYKIRLTAAHLGIALERRAYDIMNGETRTPEFLATINGNGRIPVLEIGGRRMPESNAACHWLAAGSPLIPADDYDHADMLHWMFWEQYSHEPNIATMRFLRLYVGEDQLSQEQRDSMPGRLQNGNAALALMDAHLAGRAFFLGDRYSLADISLYAYTHVAEEGGFALSDYPAVRQWLDRVAARPGHVPIDS